MPKISMKQDLNVAADQVWNLIGHFNALPDWHPGVEASELKALLKASERQGDPELSRAAAHSVNALRAAAVRDAWEGAEGDDGWAALLRFEARYSPRNYAVCGAPWATELQF